MNPLQLIEKYYPTNTEAFHILLTHSRSVADKALEIARLHPDWEIDLLFVEEAALLHDIGIFLCDAPGIDCHGDAPYICHGTLGADLLRKEGFPKHALVAERHTGTGLSLQMIQERKLPLPNRELCPISLEEKLICFADKFFSKTQLTNEKNIERIRTSLAKHGEDSVRIFDEWHSFFIP